MSKIEYKNFDNIIKSEDEKPLKKNNQWVPKNPFRMAMIGSSGTGKTNLLMTMLSDLMDYDKLYIISKSIHDQPIYQHLYTLSEYDESIKCYDNIKDFNIDDVDGSLTNVLVYDDVVTEKKDQPLIEQSFSYGRHKRCSIFYLSQSLFDTPKFIRMNCTSFCIFSLGDNRDVDGLHRIVGTDIDKNKFHEMYIQACVKTPHGFFFIDNDPRNPREKKYRLRFDQVFEI